MTAPLKRSETPTLNPLTEIIQLINSIEKIPTNSSQAQKPENLQWLENITKQPAKMLNHASICIFIANHTPQSPTTANHIHQCRTGGHKLAHLAEHAHCDLRLYEITPDNSHLPQISTAEDIGRALAYGMISVEEGTDFYAGATYGEESAAKVQKLVLSGLNGLESLVTFNLPEIAALCGAIIATRLAGIPILLEGLSGYAALKTLYPHAVHIGQHCALAGHFTPDILDDLRQMELHIMPPPYQTNTTDEPGIGSACLIAQLKNEIMLG